MWFGTHSAASSHGAGVFLTEYARLTVRAVQEGAGCVNVLFRLVLLRVRLVEYASLPRRAPPLTRLYGSSLRSLLLRALR